jgi:hypothetical protein
MWLEVSGGPEALWVHADECRLPDGELAFVYETDPTPPLPGWHGAPADSWVRRRSSILGCWDEARSAPMKAEQVLAYYWARVARCLEPPVGRAGPGFSAENAEWRFDLNVYEHRDLAFFAQFQADRMPHSATSVRAHRLVIATTMGPVRF